jgi:general secretion pathway protein C
MLFDNFARILAWAAPVPLIATASYWQASGVNDWLRGELAWHARSTQTTSARVLPREPMGSGAQHGPLEPADPLRAPSPGVVSAWNAPPCEEQIRAHVIVVDDERASSMAVLRWGGEGRAAVVRAGDPVGRYAVWYVGVDRVWLARGGRLCHVPMTATPAGAASRPDATDSAPRTVTNVPADVAAKVKRNATDEVEVDRSVREWAMEDPARALMGSRIVPIKKGDGVSGYRVHRLAPGSLPAMLGMREGDVVESINGADLTDPQGALGLYARLPTLDRLQVRLLREGKPITLDVRVR